MLYLLLSLFNIMQYHIKLLAIYAILWHADLLASMMDGLILSPV